MAYNSIITRPDAQALVPEEVSTEMIRNATTQSAALQMFRKIPVSRNQQRFPILSALPVAYWVTGDTGLKQSTELAWSNKFMTIEEAAVILAMPDSVVADAEQNLWAESEPYMIEALGRLVDSAIFFGTNAPASFPTNILAAATAAGNSVNEGAAASAGAFFGDIDNVYEKVEEDGFDITGWVAARNARTRLRKARATDGKKLDENRVSGKLDELDGLPIAYPMRGLFPAGGGANTNVRLFGGDWDQFVIGIRQDITMDIFREGVVQDNTGAIIFNLMQQDMTAVRLVFRMGWQVANLLNHDQPVEANRYPVGVLKY